MQRRPTIILLILLLIAVYGQSQFPGARYVNVANWPANLGAATSILPGANYVNIANFPPLILTGTNLVANEITTNHITIGFGLTVNNNVLSNTAPGTWKYNQVTNTYYDQGNVGIGTNAPDHVLHIHATTNDTVGIDSTGTDSASMLHIKNVGVQGPFFDFHSSNQRWGWGNASGGNFVLRNSNTSTDPVNGTTLFSVNPSGDVLLGATTIADGSAYLHFPTNTAPTSVTVGTTVPDFWLAIKERTTGFIYYTPCWTNH